MNTQKLLVAQESTYGPEVLLATPWPLSALGRGHTKPLDWVVCGRPGTGHLVLCGALWWPERGLHARWGPKVGGERMWVLRNVDLDLRGQDFGDATCTPLPFPPRTVTGELNPLPSMESLLTFGGLGLFINLSFPKAQVSGLSLPT